MAVKRFRKFAVSGEKRYLTSKTPSKQLGADWLWENKAKRWQWSDIVDANHRDTPKKKQQQLQRPIRYKPRLYKVRPLQSAPTSLAQATLPTKHTHIFIKRSGSQGSLQVRKWYEKIVNGCNYKDQSTWIITDNPKSNLNNFNHL